MTMCLLSEGARSPRPAIPYARGMLAGGLCLRFASLKDPVRARFEIPRVSAINRHGVCRFIGPTSQIGDVLCVFRATCGVGETGLSSNVQALSGRHAVVTGVRDLLSPRNA